MTNGKNEHLLDVAPESADYAALVREAVGGDDEAMERLLVRAQEAAYRFSLLVCGHPEDAEDVMQDALLQTYRRVRQIKNPSAFRTWLYQTVRNACLMKRRRSVGEPRQHVSLEQGPRDGTDEGRAIEIEDRGRPADQQLIDAWLGERLRVALARLPAPLRIILVLREIEGLSTHEVAEVVGISDANVKTRLHRARMAMRKALEGHEQ